jgi:predicted CXXCH cytochrome family protein
VRFKPHLRLILMCLVFIVPFTGLLAISLANPDPPKTAKTKPDTSKKAPSFAQSLFAKATADDYIEDEMCKECHAESHKSWNNSPHALFVSDPHKPADQRGCQSCHGPGGPHVSHLKDEEHPYNYIISYTRLKPEESAAACLRCHNDTLTDAHWRRTSHARAGVSCVACHQLHTPDRLLRDREKPAEEKSADDKKKGIGSPPALKPTQSVRQWNNVAAPDPKAMLKADEATLCGSCHRKSVSEFRFNFHHPLPEGRMVCSDCHEVHPNRDQQKNLRTNKSSCITCHADIAGPFAFEHEPVSDLSGDGCLTCHKPHGSNNPRMLSTFSRGMCNQCHSDKANNHYPGRTCWQSGCHVAIHGSNHDNKLFRR